MNHPARSILLGLTLVGLSLPLASFAAAQPVAASAPAAATLPSAPKVAPLPHSNVPDAVLSLTKAEQEKYAAFNKAIAADPENAALFAEMKQLSEQMKKVTRKIEDRMQAALDKDPDAKAIHEKLRKSATNGPGALPPRKS